MDDGSAYLVLLNPTGGMLGGDCLTSEIVLEQGAHVTLTTASATSIYRTDDLPAIQHAVIGVGEGATLEYFPEHLIPHPGAALRQSLRVDLAAGGRVFLWDAMACGRVAREERWRFREIVSGIEVLVRGKPVWLTRTKINPHTLAPEQTGVAESYAYSGSLAILADSYTRWPRLIAEMNAQFAAFPEVHGGVSKLAGDGCLVRLLVNSAVDLTGLKSLLWAVARALVLDLPAFESRKY